MQHCILVLLYIFGLPVGQVASQVLETMEVINLMDYLPEKKLKLPFDAHCNFEVWEKAKLHTSVE